MWICAKCGEPHQDQFKDCWKCVGAEMAAEEHVSAAPPRPTPPPRERRLRPLGSFLSRAAVGFLVGALLSLMGGNYINAQIRNSGIGHLGQDLSPEGLTVLALIVGAVLGALVGLFFWVVFPYESTDSRQIDREEDK